jgi:hypothetical protein
MSNTLEAKIDRLLELAEAEEARRNAPPAGAVTSPNPRVLEIVAQAKKEERRQVSEFHALIRLLFQPDAGRETHSAPASYSGPAV